MKSKFRIETDSLGEVRVPSSAYWGAQTQRAIENFPISGLRFPRRFIRALGLLKKACAQVNLDTRRLDRRRAAAIIRAAEEVAEGRWDDQFPLDIFQTGSGTSTNMNANEVIANRAIELLGGELGSKRPVHPNDDVNRSQSSNDTFPTAMHIAAVQELRGRLFPAVRRLRDTLDDKARAFVDVVGDLNPVHSDREYAAHTVFKVPIVPGIFTAGLVSAVIGTELPGPGSIYLSQTLKFLKPVKAGETITARVEVVEVLPEKSRVRLWTVCVNQDGDDVLSGEAWVLVPRAATTNGHGRTALASVA